MKVTIKIILLLTISLFCFMPESQATHLAGGDMEYINIGKRQWLVRLTLYRFCNGLDLCLDMNCTKSLTIQPMPNISVGGLNPQACSGSAVNLTVTLIKVEDAEKKKMDYCGQQSKNSCTNMGQVAAGTYNPSVEKYIFEGILDMSGSAYNNVCPYYTITYSECCRNSTTNITGEPTFAIYSTINIHDRSGSNELKNNSPLLKNEAIITFRAGVKQLINAGAIDPDGDSLSYRIVKSLQAYNSPVTYNPPYNEFTPFPLNQNQPPHNEYASAARLVLDSATGDISLNAKNSGTVPIPGDVSMEITQWAFRINPSTGKKESYITGTTMRNLQIYSLATYGGSSLGDRPPYFETNVSLQNNKPKTNYSVLAGEQLCFTITARDPDADTSSPFLRSDTTYISWNEGIVRPGSLTFAPDYQPLQARPREDRWKFCWQTSISDTQDAPHYFSTIAYNNFCPDPGKIQQGFSIKVVAPGLASLVKKQLNCGRWIAEVKKTKVSQVFASAKLEVAVNPFDYTFSGGASVYFAANPNPSSAGSDPVIIITETIQFTRPGKYMVRYITTVPSGEGALVYNNIYYDTINVAFDTLYNLSVTDQLVCKNDSFAISPTLSGGKAPFSIKWFAASSTVPISSMPELHGFSNLLSPFYRIEVRDSLSCIRTDTFNISVKQLPQDFIIRSSASQCLNNNQFLFGHKTAPHFNSYTLHWNSETTNGSDSLFTVSFATYGTKNIKVIITDLDHGCIDSASTSVTVYQQPGANVMMRSDSVQCLAGNNFTLAYILRPGILNTWDIEGSSKTDSLITHIYSSPGLKTVRLFASDHQGCKDTAFQYLLVKAMPQPQTIQGPQAGLLPDSVYEYSVFHYPNETYLWTGSNLQFLQGETTHSVKLKWLAGGSGKINLQRKHIECMAQDSLQLTIGSVGLKEEAGLAIFNIHPNPNRGSFNILLNAQQNGKATVKLYNILGEEVLSQQHELLSGENNVGINVSVQPGIYLVMIKKGESITTQKITVYH